MLEVWYIKIISMKNSMENSMENQAKFNELIHIYETLQQTQAKLTKFDKTVFKQTYWSLQNSNDKQNLLHNVN